MIAARLRAAAALLFVLGLGFAAGLRFERHRPKPPPVTLSVAEEHDAAVAELRQDLGLDDAQVAQVHAILTRHHAVVQQSWEHLRPEVETAMRQVHIEIAGLLRPDQRERFHNWLSRRREDNRGWYPAHPLER